MARILVLTLVFPPDNVSTAVIVGELSADLKAAGHDVTVVTTIPHYNRDPDAESRQALKPVWKGLLWRSEFHGMRVLHVGMPRKTGHVLARLLAWSRFHVLSLVAAATLVRDVDVIVTPSPPLTIGICAWLLGCFYRAPYVYNVQELYPDIAINLGALRRAWVIRILLALERFVYARAKAVTVIAARMRRRVVEKGVPEEKVRLIPNFVDVDDLSPLSRENAFSREHDLSGVFVVTYAGNIGPAQGLETVVEAASLLKEEKVILFLFVGEGASTETLKELVRDRGLTNIRFLPHQPYGLVAQIYAASDLCLVALAAHAGSDAIPSKVYRIMACARPVLACADSRSDLAELVKQAGCGTVVEPGQPRALAQAVREASRHAPAYRLMGEAGRRHVVTHYARGSISAQYDALVREIVGAPAGIGKAGV